MAGSAVGHVGWPACAVSTLLSFDVARSPRRFSLPARPATRRSCRNHVVCVAALSQQHVSFRSSVRTDLPFREFRTVSFEDYMEDRDRVFNALFPDTHRQQKLNDEEWRIFMLPLEFFFLSVKPVIDMRITLMEPTKGSVNSSRRLSLEATRWELRGLGYEVKPTEFDLGIVGTLYPEVGRLGSSRLKGQMELRVDLSIPPSLGLIPPSMIESVGTALLSQVLENMKDRVNRRLLKDYQLYALQQHAPLSSA